MSRQQKSLLRVRFTVGLSDSEVAEDRAMEKFGQDYGDPNDREEAFKAGFIDREGKITEKGWEVLWSDGDKIEKSAFGWLKKKFANVSDVMHGDWPSSGDLFDGHVEVDIDDPAQLDLLLLGVNERIDMDDTSYGDLG